MMRKGDQKGFLLIETLVAIVIIAVVVVTVLSGMQRALKMTLRSEQFTEKGLPMETLLFEMETGMRMDLLANGGAAVKDDQTFEVIKETVISEKPEEEAGEAAFYRFNIRTSGEEGLKQETGEIFLGQGLFS